ncbi:MAG: GNAT family N-acetyltransferase [Mobilitalea sp.]
MEYVISEVEDNDLEECVEVIHQGFATVAKDFGLTIENCPTNGAFIPVDRLIAERENGQLMYKMIDKGRIIGYMQLEKSKEDKYFLQKLVVLPEYRHLGYGRKLLDYSQDVVQKAGGNYISIGIIEENTILKDWYLAYGFHTTGIRKFEHLPFTVGFMELVLSEKNN